MTGFFARMGERAAGVEAALRARRPARFESADPAAGEPPVEEVEVLAPPAAHAPAHDLEGDARTGRPGTDGAEEREASPPAPERDQPGRSRDPEAAADARPAPPPAPVAPPKHALPPERIERTEPPVATAARSHERAEPPGKSAPPPAASHPDERRAPAPPPQPPARRPVRRRRARPPAPATPALDLARLLREHVVPALTDSGAVGRHERPVVVDPAAPAPTRAAGPPAPGTFTVRATPPAGPPVAAAEPPEARGVTVDPAVHLHIERVVVTRAPAPAPPRPAPPPPPRPTVDHAAYLARRRVRA